MTDEQFSFDDDIDPRSKARATDPWTSRNAIEAITKMGRPRNQRWLLFETFVHAGDYGMTSEQAADWTAGVSRESEYSTRCSELQRMGLIEPTGETRRGRAGQPRDVYAVTERGREAWEKGDE